MNLMRVWGYSYADGTYIGGAGSDNCPFQLATISQGSCRAWGNPLSEIYLEAVRYFALNAGRAPTPAFDPTDTLAFPAMSDAAWTADPLAATGGTASANIIVLNPAVPSYDNDATASTILGGATPQALTSALGSGEGLNGNPLLVGRIGPANDQHCTAKQVDGLGDAYGLCPLGPTLDGSFHMAGIAHYARTHDLRSDLPGSQKLATFGLELSSGAPTLPISIGPVGIATVVQLTPAFRLIGNGGGGQLVKLKVVRAHTEVDPSDRSSPGLPNTVQDGLNDITGAGAPTVNFPVATAGTGIYHGKFYLSWDDSEQGGDFDQDQWGMLDYVVNTNVLPPTVTVTTRTVAESTSNGQLFGFVIRGTSKDGFHAYSGIEGANFVDPSGVPGCSNCRALSEAGGQRDAQSYTFTIAGGGARLPESPLYYAAKWGGFNDGNGNNVPDLTDEWDTQDSNGVPDNYFRVTNAATLDHSLALALSRIDGSIVAAPDFDGDGTPDALDSDDDNDGLPDSWEQQYGLNPLNAGDADQDGRSNLIEFQQGTNPTIADLDTDGDGQPNALDLDDDNDGLPDTWEQQHGLDPLNATDATADGDNDGRSNLLEFQQGTDPTTYESSPTHLLLTFEGLQDNEHPEDYFAGGVGTLGSRSGPDYGITFTNPVTAAIDADAGGSGNFGGEPSPNTTLGFQTNSWMNVASGFSGGLSFYYSNPNSDSSITIYAGPNRTGAVLAVLALPRTPFNGQPDPSGTLSPFVVANVEFQGQAHSVDFSGLAFSAYLDDLKLYAIALPAGPASNLAQTVPTLPPLVMLGLAVILTALGVRQGRRQP